MSAWYLFSVLGYHPVNPVLSKYIAGTCVLAYILCLCKVLPLASGSPFFDCVSSRSLIISTLSASSGKPYVAAITIDGVLLSTPIIRHEQIVNSANVEFEMSATPVS